MSKRDTVTVKQLTEFFAQIKSGRVTRARLQEFLMQSEAALVEKLEDTRQPIASTAGSYPVVVDYGKTLAEMIAAGHYDWVNDDITPDHFPISGSGVVECTLELIHLNKRVTTTEALQHLEEKGMRPATLPELLALGAAYSELQREFPLVAFGSVWAHPDGSRHVPYLAWHDSERNLNLAWDGNGLGWHASCRFVAVRK